MLEIPALKKISLHCGPQRGMRVEFEYLGEFEVEFETASVYESLDNVGSIPRNTGVENVTRLSF